VAYGYYADMMGAVTGLFNVGALLAGLFYAARVLANVVRLSAKQNEAIEYLARRLADLERERANEMGAEFTAIGVEEE
jgi:hypothetical protein